jgi:biuret amidohydrolase
MESHAIHARSSLVGIGVIAQDPRMATTPKPAITKRQQRIDEWHRCKPEQTALLVVDMQHGFLDPGASLEVPKGRLAVPVIRRLLEACRAVGMPIIFTQFVYAQTVPCLRGDPFGIEHLPARAGQSTGFGKPSGNCLVGAEPGQGAESAEMVPDLAPLKAELVVASHGYDKFLDTPLDLALRSRGITHLLVTGVTTDICVNATVLSAANRNYRVTVVTDGVATIDDSLQAACFTIWERKFARLRSAAQVLSELKRSRSAG